MHPALWVAVAVVALVGLWVLFQFNRMVSLRNRVRESWGNVDVELHRRHDLIPNLVATIKGAARHERQVFLDVTAARAAAMKAPGSAPEERRLVAGLEKLLALAEDYPRLKTSTNFLQLQAELAITEDRIAAARRVYNGNVRDYRDQILQWPGTIVARAFRFEGEPFYDVSEVRVRALPLVRLGA